MKRDLQGQMKVNKTLDTYYDLIEIYKGLDEYDQEMVWSIMQTVKKAGEKRKRDRENTEAKISCISPLFSRSCLIRLSIIGYLLNIL